MTAEEILNSELNKTEKMKRLFELGHTRKQVAEMLGVGYGFVQNVYAKVYGTGRANNRSLAQAIEEYRLTNFTFNHTFGVEIEAFGISRDELITELRHAGIEVSGERYNHNTREHWKVTSDSSIQGVNTFELVSPKLLGEAGFIQLKTALLIVKGLEARVNKTCGLHVHFDATGFNLQTWKNLYKNYGKLELLIDSFMPESRRADNNRYCYSMRKPDFEQKIDSVSNLLPMEEGLKQIERQITLSDRYFKLNSQAYWRHRSVEFRQHAGSTDFRKIKNWILFLARLVEYSKQATVATDNWATLGLFLDRNLIQFFENRKNELASGN